MCVCVVCVCACVCVCVCMFVCIEYIGRHCCSEVPTFRVDKTNICTAEKN